jgi:putative nucleotidyltransferase with HDIG domain
MARSRHSARTFAQTVVPLSVACLIIGTAATLGVLAILGVPVSVGLLLGVLLVWTAACEFHAALLLRSLKRSFTEPLLHVVAVADRVSDGDLSAHARPAALGPVGDIADAVNRMTESFRTRSDAETARVLELTMLYETSRTLGSTLDLAGLLGTVLEEALGVLEVDVGYVMLRDRINGRLEMRARRGAAGVASEQLVDRSVTDWVAEERRPLILNPGTAAAPAPGVIHATLCVPLADSDGAIGTIMVGSTDGRDKFTSDDVRLLSTIANHATVAIRNVELFASLREAYLGTVRSLAAAIDAKDTYTRGHSERVAEYGTLVARRLGLSEEECLALELAAYLHDIGKIGIPESILRKPGRLDDDEFVVMKSHPIVGASILTPVEFPWPIMPAVRHHHEHFDGRGYPAGLKGSEIPLLARILTVADSFEAMVSDRPYRKGREHPEAIAEIVRCSGSQFDPEVVDVFVEVVGGLRP